jgi:hypothetical protein
MPLSRLFHHLRIPPRRRIIFNLPIRLPPSRQIHRPHPRKTLPTVDRRTSCTEISLLAKDPTDKSVSHRGENRKVIPRPAPSAKSSPASVLCCGMIPNTFPNYKRK